MDIGCPIFKRLAKESFQRKKKKGDIQIMS